MYNFIHNTFSVHLGYITEAEISFLFLFSFFLLPQEQSEVTENNLRICMV